MLIKRWRAAIGVGGDWLGRTGGCAQVGNQQLTCLADAGRVGRTSQELPLFLPAVLIAV